jgi:hypothetical protein
MRSHSNQLLPPSKIIRAKRYNYESGFSAGCQTDALILLSRPSQACKLHLDLWRVRCNSALVSYQFNRR